MAAPQQQQQRPAATAAAAPATAQKPTAPAAQPPTDFERLLQKDHRMEYIPFGGEDKIRLSVSIVQRMICVPTRTGKICDDNQALKFMAMCQAKRMNPFEGDCFLIGYDTNSGPSFSMITAHQTYLKRAEIHPEFDGMKSGLLIASKVEGEPTQITEIEGDFYIPGEQTVVGGWAEVYFKNRKIPMKKRLRLERFRKSFGVWSDDAAGMICKCAEADALRSSFPTMLGGLYLRDEIEFDMGKAAEKERDKFAKPLFAGTMPQNPPEPTSGVPQGEPGAPAATSTPPEPGKPGEATPAGALLALCAAHKVTEKEVLDALAQIGLTDGNITSLEAFCQDFPSQADVLAKNFAATAKDILESRN